MNVRHYQKRLFILFIFTIVFIYTTHFLWNNNKNLECLASASTLKSLDELMSLIKEPLNALNLSFFMCYNSLWGTLKMKGPLPWQISLDLCVLNKEMSSIDEGYLAKSFKRHGLIITYNSGGGFYRVNKAGESVVHAILTVFEEDLITHQMRRVGWIHRMMPPNSCDELHCFPPELIAKPLPTAEFNKHLVPVPRDGIEIQKYLFPHTWWKEVTPPNCI